ncbi:MAG: LacI family transcriptional regulator, partial [Rhizobiaceae bacterium]
LLEHANPMHVFAQVMFGLDDRLRSAELFEQALRAHPDIIGIYNAGGANSGIAAVLDRSQRGGSIMWVGHELTERSREWLKSGLMDIVLDQAPEIQARRAIDIILRQLGLIEFEVDDEPIRFLTINAENL